MDIHALNSFNMEWRKVREGKETDWMSIKVTARKLLIEVLFSRPWIRVCLLALSFASSLFGLLAPLFQREFVDRLTGHPSVITGGLDWSLISSESLVLGAFVCVLLQLLFSQWVSWLGSLEALQIQKNWSSRLYSMVLQTPVVSRFGRKSTGELVTNMTTDIPGATILLEQSIPQGMNIIFPFILTPLLLHQALNIPWLPMWSLLILVLVGNIWMAERQSIFFANFKSLASERVSLVVQWIQNIRILRILGWMTSFEERIFRKREIETKNRIQMLTNGQTMNAIAASLNFAINLLVLAGSFLWLAQRLTPGTVLAILWIVGVFLTRPFRQLPWFFTFVFDAWTSIQRISRSFEQLSRELVPAPPELGTDTPRTAALRRTSVGTSGQDSTEDIPIQDPNRKLAITFTTPALEVSGLSLELQGQKILHEISLSLRQGEHVGLVGDIGSGKSMLLLSLLKETPAEFRKFEILGQNALHKSPSWIRTQFSFVPQEGFIMNASLRDNLLLDFGSSSDRDQELREILGQVELGEEVAQFPEGLDTLFGERGVNLSGGQRQRMSLARLEVFERPILLLDDVLSAVDEATEKKLVEGLLKLRWKHQTLLLATHRLSVLQQMDRLYFLHRGRIEAEGSWTQLQSRNPLFRNFVRSIGNPSNKAGSNL
ncbi:MAG: ABC transporter ATP-binding protein [Bdellovibrio sp.]